MDCSICSSFPMIIRPPRNTICGSCYEGIKTAVALISSSEPATPAGNQIRGDRKVVSTSGKGISELAEWIKDMKNVECELNERISFLAGSVASFNDQLHTDIDIKPGNGPSIPTHRAILASRSEIFKNMLDSDTCMMSPSKDTAISIPDLTFEELQSLVEFLYTGNLSHEDLEKHVYSLALAAHKYEISYLQKLCDRFMLKSLSTMTALDVLEVSDMCSNLQLKEAVIEFIVKNFEEIAFLEKYEGFCSKNPHLSVQITRASLAEAKSKRKSHNCGEICHTLVQMNGIL